MALENPAVNGKKKMVFDPFERAWTKMHQAPLYLVAYVEKVQKMMGVNELMETEDANIASSVAHMSHLISRLN